jgi:hypothetical protein
MTVTGVTPTTFNVSNATISSVTAMFSVTVNGNGTTATYTVTPSTLGLLAGSTVVVFGFGTAAFNGTFTMASQTATTFTVANATNSGGTLTGGNVYSSSFSYLVTVTSSSVGTVSTATAMAAGNYVVTNTQYPTMGSNTVAFNGNQYFSLNASLFPLGASNATYFFVSKGTSGSNRQAIFNHGANAGSSRNFASGQTANSYYFGPGNTSGSYPTSGTLNMSVNNLISVTLNNQIAAGWANGSSFTTNNNQDQQVLIPSGGLNTPSSNSVLGMAYGYLSQTAGTHTFPFIGNISEIIVFNTALSNADRQTIEGYLAWKWGLQANLPTSHPYYPSTSSLSSISPTNYSGLALWLDAADSNTISFSSGTNVSAWNDKSGNGNTATQATTGLQPVLLDNGIYFGSTQFLNLLSSGAILQNVPYACGFVVANVTQAQTQNTNRGGILIISNGTSGNTRFTLSLDNINNPAPGVLARTLDADSVSVAGESTTYTYNSRFLSVGEANYSAGTLKEFLNGTQSGGTISITSGNTSNTTSIATPTINVNSAVQRLTNTYVYELILFRTALTTTQRQQIEGYLAYKWGLQASLPVGHPYSTALVPFNPVYRPFSRNFVPTDINNCQVWLDPADSSAVSLTGSNVTTIRDKSGNGNNATNGSSTITYASTLNGLPVLLFPTGGGSNSLTTPNIIRDPVNHTYFFVLKYAATGTSSQRALSYGAEFFGHSGGVGTNTIYLENNNAITAGATAYSFYTATTSGNTDAFFGGNTFVCCAIRQNGVTTITTNGVNNGTGGGSALGNISSGSGYSITGGTQGCSIGDVIIYNAALNNSERQMVEGYLVWKWGLRTGGASFYNGAVPLSVPTSHPFYKFPPPKLTPLIPTSQFFNRGFTPYDLSPTIWLDPQDSSTYAVDGNNRVVSWRNKGVLAGQGITITTVTSTSILTFTGTSLYAAVGQSIIFSAAIAGTPGLVAGTVYYIITISAQTAGNITVSLTPNGAAITTLTNATGLSVAATVNPAFTIPVTGTGTGITGPLLTSSSIGSGLGQQYFDFSNGGTFNITAASIGATPFTTLTLTTAFAHNIPVGAMIYFVCNGGAYVGVTPTVPIGAFTGSGTAVTLTLSSTSGIVAGSVVIIANVTPTTLNGTYTVTSVAGNTITFPNTTATASVTVAGSVTQPTSATTLYTGPFQIASAVVTGTTTLTITTQVAHNIVVGYPVTLTINTGTFLGGGSATSFSGTYTAQTGTTGSTIVLTTTGLTAGQMSIIDGYVQNNVGTNGHYLTQAGTTGSTIVLTSLTPRFTGAISNFFGRVEYGVIPFTSAILTSTTSMTLRTPIDHGITGTPAINLNFNSFFLPFQSTLPTTGTTLNPACLSFTSATVSGATTLTITVTTNPFFINSATPNYVGLSSLAMTLPTGTLFTGSTSATGLSGLGYVTQSGSNTTTLVLTIASSPNGALTFNGVPGMIVSTTTGSVVAQGKDYNSTQTITSASGNTIVLPVPTFASVIAGRLLPYSNPSFQIPVSTPAVSNLTNYAGNYINFPLNGRAIESTSLSTALSTTSSTIVWVSHFNPSSSVPSRQGAGFTTQQSCLIAAAFALNGLGGNDTTSNGRDFKISNGSYAGNAARYGLMHNATTKLTLNTAQPITDISTSSFRVNSCVMNFPASSTSDVPASTVGISSHGWRYDGFANTSYVATAGSQVSTTLAPTHLRIGGNTNATTTYSSFPLSGNWYEGGVGDILIFNSILTREQRQLLEGFLAQKYRCQTTLATAATTATTFIHPYRLNSLLPSGSTIYSNSVSLWLDAADSTTFSNSGLSTVQWNDKSGNGRNATYYTGGGGTNYATYVTNSQAGLGGVRLVNDGVTTNGLQTTATFPLYTAQQFSFFVVANITGTSSANFISNLQSFGQWSINIGTSNLSSYVGTNGTIFTQISPSPAVNVIGTTFLISLSVTPTSFTQGFETLYVNGQNKTTGTGTTPITQTSNLILQRGGGANTSTYYELIGFSNALSDIQRQQVEGYLAWKWQINSLLPTTHAYYRVRP